MTEPQRSLPDVPGVPRAHIERVFGGEPVSDPAVVFGSEDYYVPHAEVPVRFKDRSDVYVRTVSARFFGGKMPEMSVEVREGVDMTEMRRRIDASLKTWGPKHEHKEAMVAYMMWLCAPEVTPPVVK